MPKKHTSFWWCKNSLIIVIFKEKYEKIVCFCLKHSLLFTISFVLEMKNKFLIFFSLFKSITHIGSNNVVDLQIINVSSNDIYNLRKVTICFLFLKKGALLY